MKPADAHTATDTLRVDEVSESEWRELTAQFADHNFEQTVEYARNSAGRSNASVRLLAVKDAERTVAAACVRLKTFPLLRRGLAYISAGPLLHLKGERSDADLQQRALAALKHRLVSVEGHILVFRLPISLDGAVISDRWLAQNHFAKTGLTRSYRTILVGLDGEEAALRKNLAGKWRTDLNYAQKQGLAIESGDAPRLWTRFLALFGEMHQAKNFDVHVDPRSFMTLPAAPLGLTLLIATQDGHDAAGHVVSILGDTAVYLFGATNDIGRSTKAGYLLNWQSMLLAKDAGCRWYDLGGIDPDNNPGGYRFKSRMGGHDVAALGPYRALPGGLAGFAGNAALGLLQTVRRRSAPNG